MGVVAPGRGCLSSRCVSAAPVAWEAGLVPRIGTFRAQAGAARAIHHDVSAPTSRRLEPSSAEIQEPSESVGVIETGAKVAKQVRIRVNG